MSSEGEKPQANLNGRAIGPRGAAARSRSGSILRARHGSALLARDSGLSVSEVARFLHTGERSVDNFLERGVLVEARDSSQSIGKRGKGGTITPEAEAWVVESACQAPGHLGYRAGCWTIAMIVKHVRSRCRDAGHPSLARLGMSAVCKLLSRYGVCPGY